MDFKLTAPVLIIAFNRPDLTRLVFDEVRKAKPPHLFLAVNAPRNPEEEILGRQIKSLLDLVDWDCQIHTLYPEKNTGHTWGPINAINWVFEHSETAIVLEDDCVPNQSFFRYSQELLERYKNDQRVFSIGGGVHLNPMPKQKYSYWFSPLTSTWGWAGWRRSWNKVDFEMTEWPKYREGRWIAQKIGNKYIAAKYKKGIDKAYQTRHTADFVGWDYIYNFIMLKEGGVDARPSVNLVSNVGFREDASHTKEKTPYADFPTKELGFPLKHPPVIKPQVSMEIEFYRQYDPNFQPLAKKLFRKIWKKLF